MRAVSIQTRMLTYYSVLAALLVGVAAYAVVELTVLNRMTTVINSKWLTGTSMLGEMADLLSEIHIQQLHTLIPHPAPTRAEAIATAEEFIAELAELKAAYAALIATPEERELFTDFDAKSNDYVAVHQEFMAEGPLAAAEQTNADTILDRAYHTADDQVDLLIAANTAGANADAKIVDTATSRALLVLIAISILGILLAAWTILQVRNRISRPLAAITAALTALATGTDVSTVPGAERNDEIGDMAKAFEVFRRNATDLVHAHAAAEVAEEKAQALARHDALTGLPNRRVFEEKLEEAIASAAAGETTYAVLLLDLDRFKPVNDMYGHSFGDLVLCEIAERLRLTVDKGDTVARMGGDEFAVIMKFAGPPSAFAETAIRLANRVLAVISKPIFVQETQIEVGASIGIADCPLDGTEPEMLLRAADIAMYRADRGTFRFFERSMDEELRERITFEADLRRAVDSGEIEPHYQPLIALGEGRLTGFEILARWHHPERGLIMPVEFIPRAEEIGVIGDLTYQILERACLDARTWPGELMLSLNVSPIQLRDKLFPTRLLAVLSRTGFAPRRLQIEITESALISDLDTARSILATLHALGIRIALDDFGTGYSSLYHLRELKLDQIKIDRSFINSINDNPESEKLVNGILGLAGSLGLPTTAEGIEDIDTLERLVASGCAFGQGYYLGKPMPAAAAAAFVADSATSAAGGKARA